MYRDRYFDYDPAYVERIDAAQARAEGIEADYQMQLVLGNATTAELVEELRSRDLTPEEIKAVISAAMEK